MTRNTGRSGLLLLSVLVASTAGAWQQDVRYVIDVRLDPGVGRLSATETLWYRNNSPDTLDRIWLHLYPNAYRDRNTTFARELEQAHSYEFSFAPEKDRGWMKIKRISLPGEGRAQWLDVDSARGQHRDETETPVVLPSPLEPGDSE